MKIADLFRFFSVLAMSFALVACGGGSGGGGTDAGNTSGSGAGGGGDSDDSDTAGGGGITTDPVGKADSFAFGATVDKDDDLPLMVGEYDVAIYDAPSAAETGPGKLIIDLAPDLLTMTLKNASGATLKTITVPAVDSVVDGECGDGKCINLFDQWASDPTGVYAASATGNRRFSAYNYYEAGSGAYNYFSVDFFGNGVIAGNVSGYYFRNEVTAYGASVPSIFADLAGTWTGTTQQVCGAPDKGPVSVSFTAGGEVSLNGKAVGSSCTDQTLNSAWDGLDDLLVPADYGYRLILDSRKTGGSNLGGGVFIKLPDLDGDVISEFYTNYDGSIGNTTSPDLVKQ